MNDEWLIPMLEKRSTDGIRVLLDLLEAGIKNGCVSANDVREREYDEPNIIGGVFKCLHKFGFTHTDQRVKTTKKRKHARRVDVWKLDMHNLALSGRNAITKTLLERMQNEQSKQTQTYLPL